MTHLKNDESEQNEFEKQNKTIWKLMILREDISEQKKNGKRTNFKGDNLKRNNFEKENMKK